MTKEYIKFQSLVNHYNGKLILPMVEQSKHVTRWIVTEKLDGANIQLLFQKGKDLVISSRNQIITKGSKFYDIWNVLDRYIKVLDIIQDSLDVSDSKISIRIYGELFGGSVQKRINYGTQQQLRFFDYQVEFSDEITTYSPSRFIDFLHLLRISYMYVPILASYKSLPDALVYNVEEVETRIETDDTEFRSNRNMEGVIIRPYDDVVFYYHDQIIIKKKAEKFGEIEGKVKKVKQPIDNKLLQMRMDMSKYVNRNRMFSYFSKVGEIEDFKQIGEYIKGIREDIIKDFEIDVPEVKTMSKNDRKVMFNFDRDIALLLKEYLKYLK